jgi:cell division septation protein DedD
MINNQRGGIISSIFVIPILVALMAGFFFLGYYVGKYQSKTNQSEIVVPLPEVVSDNLPKSSDFTFFKTLTDKENKTVSIDLTPRKDVDQSTNRKKSAAPLPAGNGNTPAKNVKSDPQPEKPAASAVTEREMKQPAVKKEPVVTRGPDPKIRYTLQLASYQDKEMAEADVKKMKQLGYSAFIVSSELQEKGTWYRVRLGSFSSRASAEKLQKELRAKEGITPFITME